MNWQVNVQQHDKTTMRAVVKTITAHVVTLDKDIAQTQHRLAQSKEIKKDKMVHAVDVLINKLITKDKLIYCF